MYLGWEVAVDAVQITGGVDGDPYIVPGIVSVPGLLVIGTGTVVNILTQSGIGEASSQAARYIFGEDGQVGGQQGAQFTTNSFVFVAGVEQTAAEPTLQTRPRNIIIKFYR